MDLTTLTSSFLADEPVDEFVSAIWTERYSKHGDTQIVVPASVENINKLREGTYLGLRGSKEVMQIDTQNVENNLLTVVGNTLDEAVLSERYIWAENPAPIGTGPGYRDSDAPRITDYTDETRKPGEFLSHLVDRFLINPAAFTWAADYPARLEADPSLNEIPELSLGAIDSSGTVQKLVAPIGPLYDALEALAETHKVGFSLYLHDADADTGFELKFKTYTGLDRTSDQSVNDLVRLSPELDGISDLKEVRSIAQFKNVVYIYYQDIITKHLLAPADPEPEGLERRVLVVNAEGEPIGRKYTSPGGGFTQTYVGSTEITAFREQNAKNAFANHNYIRSIDGQTSPISDYKFGTDYFLGDIIELEGLTGEIAKAQITEFIRSKDKNGEKSYPTISVV